MLTVTLPPKIDQAAKIASAIAGQSKHDFIVAAVTDAIRRTQSPDLTAMLDETSS